MEKLSEHLFEVDPIEIEFAIGQFEKEGDDGQNGAEGRIQRMFYRMPVDCFSPNQQNKLDFLVKCNYEFMSGPADNCTSFDILGRN